MKLRNKKTGEIIEVNIYKTDGYGYRDVFSSVEGEDSLAEFNEEWEDVPEEPKGYWFIAELCAGLQKKQDTDNGEDRFNKEIGNYFETKEEAEKAVEKLKAWKRLKDKGFRFSYHSFLDRTISYKVPVADEKIGKDLDLLFGGEE